MAKTPAKKTAKTSARSTTRTVTAAGPSRDVRDAASGFNAKANALAARAERSARLSGEKTATTEYVVMPGKTVRQNGFRIAAGETVKLGAADAERMLAKGIVGEGAKGKAAQQQVQDQAEQARQAQEDAEQAQREADEQAAADRAAAQEASGQLSGAENR